MLGASTSLRPAAPPAGGRRAALAPRGAPPPPPRAPRAPPPPRALRPADADLGPTVLEPYLGAPVPARLNTIPHSRETRRHFYAEAAAAVGRALAAGETRVAVRATFPELNTEFDVYRVGTLLEMVREIAGAAAAAGRPRVKVCVQQALGAGVFQGTPLSLSGVSRILGSMEWGDAGGLAVMTGNLGAREVEGADALLLVAPQNVQGHSVLPLLEETAAAAAAAGLPLVLVNAK
jgi:adenylate kinase